MIEEIFLVRHAEPDRTTTIPYMVPPGPPLTEGGQREARAAADWLDSHQIDHIFSSPFLRTRSTAERIAERLILDVTETERLGEGAPGEREEQVRTRVAEILQQLDDTPLQRVALVTHGVCVKMILLHTTNNQIDLSGHRYDYGNHSPTAGIWHGVRGEGNTWRWKLAFQPAAGQVVASGQAEQVAQ